MKFLRVAIFLLRINATFVQNFLIFHKSKIRNFKPTHNALWLKFAFIMSCNMMKIAKIFQLQLIHSFQEKKDKPKKKAPEPKEEIVDKTPKGQKKGWLMSEEVLICQ